jgi:L-cysteate sulfo-lyase
MNAKSKLADIIKNYDSVDLSILPTTLYRMDRLSELLGASLYCKRDDLSGFAFGGNKTRKLDYLMQDAINVDADCIVTFGSNQSNWCRMASAAATALGMDAYLLLDGKEPEIPTANLVLDQLVGANIEYLDCSDPDDIVEKVLNKVEELKKEGKRPYYLPVGGSTPVGTIGYIKAFHEILQYSADNGIEFDKIFVASGSSGTQAGLVCGSILAKWSGEIIGISVGRGKDEQENMIISLVKETFDMLGIDKTGRVEDKVSVDENYYGEGYRINTSAAGKAIKMFARHEGIILDEVYTGKAAAALLDYADRGELSDNQKILFIHTGGSVQLFE